MAKQEETQQTMEEYLLSQLDTPVVLNGRSSESRAKPRLSYAESRRKWAKAKDGTMMTKPDGSPMTKQEAIVTNILNLAMNRRSSESRAKRLAAGAMPSRDGGRPIGQGRLKAAQYIQNIQMRAKIMKIRAPFTQGGGLRRGCGIAA